MLTLYIGNDMVIEVTELTNSVTSVVDEAATVAVTLLSSGSTVAGATWPISMPHVAGGLYRATLPAGLQLYASTSYSAVITVTGAGGEVAKWEPQVVAQKRVGSC